MASAQASPEQTKIPSGSPGDREPAGAVRWVRHVFAWREHTVGLLDAELLFAALNRNLV